MALGDAQPADLVIEPHEIGAPDGVVNALAEEQMAAQEPAVARNAHDALVTETPLEDDVVSAEADDPYVTAVREPVAVGSASVAQPGWPSPGELASGFDPDAFDPLPPPQAAGDGEPNDAQERNMDPAEAWLDEDLTVGHEITIDTGDADDTQIIPIAASTSGWSEDEDFDPATGWTDDDDDWDEQRGESAIAPWAHRDDQADAAATAAPIADTDDDSSENDPVIGVTVADTDEADHDDDNETDDDPQSWDHTDEPAPTVAWDTPEVDDGDDDEGDEPSSTVMSEEAEPQITWDDDEDPEDWAQDSWADDGDAQGPSLAVPFPPPGTLRVHEAELAVPFPMPGTLPTHEKTAVELYAEHLARTGADVHFADPGVQMPAITGRIDGGANTPVVIDLANLVAGGERVEMIIEPDASGHGVRLRFGPGILSHDEPQAAAHETVAQDPVPTAHDVPDELIAPAMQALTDVVERLAAQPDAPVELDIIDIPFLTGGPRPAAAPATDPGDGLLAMDPPAVTDETFDAVEAVVHEQETLEPVSEHIADEQDERTAVTVGHGPVEDDPGRILADIRARLAALDSRRTADEHDLDF